MAVSIKHKTKRFAWAYLLTPEDSNSAGDRLCPATRQYDVVIGRLKSILWLVISIMLGLAIGNLLT